jgi:hypothetical protein
LGTGTVFTDDTQRQREMRSNGHKIDAWRKTDSYKLYVKVCPPRIRSGGAMRLKRMVKLSEGELAAIYAALAVNIRDYHQVVEVCLVCPLRALNRD